MMPFELKGEAGDETDDELAYAVAAEAAVVADAASVEAVEVAGAVEDEVTVVVAEVRDE